MMDHDLQLKLQAYFDRELPEAEAREVAQRVSQDGQAAALLQELRTTSEALQGFETGIRLPESREFFWSKIQREIARPPQPAPVSRPASLLTRFQRFLVPASAVALLTVVLTLSVGRSSATQPGELELVSEDMGALTFRSQSEGITMVWLYPRTDSKLTEDTSPIDFDPE
jgi:anti-sigma factor RsiW